MNWSKTHLLSLDKSVYVPFRGKYYNEPKFTYTSSDRYRKIHEINIMLYLLYDVGQRFERCYGQIMTWRNDWVAELHLMLDERIDGILTVLMEKLFNVWKCAIKYAINMMYQICGSHTHKHTHIFDVWCVYLSIHSHLRTVI